MCVVPSRLEKGPAWRIASSMQGERAYFFLFPCGGKTRPAFLVCLCVTSLFQCFRGLQLSVFREGAFSFQSVVRFRFIFASYPVRFLHAF